MSEKPTHHLLTALLAAFVLLCVPLGYVGGYYSLVARGTTINEHVSPEYRGGFASTRRFFRPMHQVDRRLRPSYWTSPERELRISLEPSVEESQPAAGD